MLTRLRKIVDYFDQFQHADRATTKDETNVCGVGHSDGESVKLTLGDLRLLVKALESAHTIATLGRPETFVVNAPTCNYCNEAGPCKSDCDWQQFHAALLRLLQKN